MVPSCPIQEVGTQHCTVFMEEIEQQIVLPNIRRFVCVYRCTHVCTVYTYVYVRMYVRMYIHTYVCMYVCMYICTYVCMYCLYVCTYDMRTSILHSAVFYVECGLSETCVNCIQWIFASDFLQLLALLYCNAYI